MEVTQDEKKIVLTRENYYDVGDERNLVISNSTLGYINPNQGGTFLRFKNYLSKKDERTESLSLERGRLLHTYIENKDEFFVEADNKPSDAICKVVQLLVEEFKDAQDKLINASTMKARILEHCATVDYGQSWNEDTRVNKIVKEGTAYFTHLLENNGKHMISASTRDILMNAITALERSPERLYIIDLKSSDAATPYGAYLLGERVFFKREYPILFELDGITCKALLDVVHIDFTKKEIMIRDLKTTSQPVAKFMGTTRYVQQGQEVVMDWNNGSFQNYHYYRQMAFYFEAIRSQLPAEHFDIAQWRFLFIIDVVETCEPYEMQSYQIMPNWVYAGVAEVKGLLRLVKEYIKEEKLDVF